MGESPRPSPKASATSAPAFAILPETEPGASGALRFQTTPSNVRPMTTDRIEINPKVMLGKPVIRGTRIPVELVVRKLGEGMSQEELLDAYPRLTTADIQAALCYAADTLAHETVVLHAAA